MTKWMNECADSWTCNLRLPSHDCLPSLLPADSGCTFPVYQHRTNKSIQSHRTQQFTCPTRNTRVGQCTERTDAPQFLFGDGNSWYMVQRSEDSDEATGVEVWDSNLGRGKRDFLFELFRGVLCSIQCLIQWNPKFSPWVKQPDREADHSPPFNVDVKGTWRYISTLLTTCVHSLHTEKCS